MLNLLKLRNNSKKILEKLKLKDVLQADTATPIFAMSIWTILATIGK